MMTRVRRWREESVLRRAMAPRKDVGRGEGRRRRYTVEEKDMVGRGNEEDAGTGTGGGDFFLEFRR